MLRLILFCLMLIGAAAGVGFVGSSYLCMRKAGRYLDDEEFNRWRKQAVGRLWMAFGCFLVTAMFALLYFGLQPTMGLPFIRH